MIVSLGIYRYDILEQKKRIGQWILKCLYNFCLTDKVICFENKPKSRSSFCKTYVKVKRKLFKSTTVCFNFLSTDSSLGFVTFWLVPTILKQPFAKKTSPCPVPNKCTKGPKTLWPPTQQLQPVNCAVFAKRTCHAKSLKLWNAKQCSHSNAAHTFVCKGHIFQHTAH